MCIRDRAGFDNNLRHTGKARVQLIADATDPNNATMKFIGIIPARYASPRFPAKPLAVLGGKPVIQRVYEQVSGILDEACLLYTSKTAANTYFSKEPKDLSIEEAATLVGMCQCHRPNDSGN